MRLFYFLLILGTLFIGQEASAQNWQCMQPGEKIYFTNSSGYLRGMRIDSTRTIGTATIHYPFHTLRGSYRSNSSQQRRLDTNGGSWLGQAVIAAPSGETYFLNGAQDTVVIKTLAGLGDSWTFYNDTSATYYVATIAAQDTITVENTLDSGKTITIHAYNATGPLPAGLIDNYPIILTKNHGLFQTFEYYNFPQILSGNRYFDYFADLIGQQGAPVHLFTRTAFENPLGEEVYDFKGGDRYQYKIIKLANGLGVKNVQFHSRQESAFQISYSTTETEIYNTQGTNGYTTRSTNNNFTITKGMVLIVDTLTMPEEYGSKYIYRYFPADSTQCITSAVFSRGSNYILTDNSVNIFEPCGFTESYKVGRGRVYNAICYEPLPGGGTEEQLTYTITNGMPCGNYNSLAINAPKVIATDLMIFPNPAHGELFIKSNPNIFKEVQLLDIQGRMIRECAGTGTLLSISLKNVPPGTYLVRVKTNTGMANRMIVVD